jgi:hypothetical protein
MNFTKTLFFFFLVSISFFHANAQDTIALKSGQTIIAPIDEVGEQYIIYYKMGENGKPISKAISITDIRRINYKSGFSERFDQKDIQTKDNIEFTNGLMRQYKIVELGENSIMVDAGKKDSTILLNDVANIIYANGFKEKYHDLIVKAPQVIKPTTSPKIDTKIIKVDKAVNLPDGEPPTVQTTLKVNNAPLKIRSNKKGDIQILDPIDNISMGIGYVTDSLSGISQQFYIYDMLAHNLLTKGPKRIIPVLTLRRGLCEYYFTGSIRSPQSRFLLWQKGTLVDKFFINTPENFVLNDLMKRLYIKLDSLIMGQVVPFKSLKLNFPDFPVTDFASTLSIKNNLLLNAANYTPPLDDYASISREYLKPMADIDTASLSKVLSYSFNKQSLKNKSRNPDYVKYSTIIEDYNKTLPQYPVIPINAQRDQGPIYWIDKDLKTRNVSPETVKYLECVYPLYTSNKLKGFFFESSFVDDKIKESAKQAILPLYKRPGAVLTYLQCGKEFAKLGFHDAAIESYLCGLTIVNNLNTTASFREFLKASLFEQLAISYRANNQGASAIICDNLLKMHKKLYNSHLYDTDNQSVTEATQKLSEYFGKVETDALEARSKKRSASWLSVLSTLGTIASAVNDASQGSSTPSDQTTQLMNSAMDNSTKAYEIKQASLTTTAKAAEVFNKAFGDLMIQLHIDNTLSATKPVFAIDFLMLLTDKKATNEVSQEINDFLLLMPGVQPVVTQYLYALNKTGSSPANIKDVYSKFGKLELEVYAAEASGTGTNEKNLLTYK